MIAFNPTPISQYVGDCTLYWCTMNGHSATSTLVHCCNCPNSVTNVVKQQTLLREALRNAEHVIRKQEESKAAKAKQIRDGLKNLPHNRKKMRF